MKNWKFLFFRKFEILFLVLKELVVNLTHIPTFVISSIKLESCFVSINSMNSATSKTEKKNNGFWEEDYSDINIVNIFNITSSETLVLKYNSVMAVSLYSPHERKCCFTIG